MLSGILNKSVWRALQVNGRSFSTSSAVVPPTLYRTNFRGLQAYEKKLAEVQSNNKVRGSKTEYFLKQMVNSSMNNHKEKPFYNTLASANSFYYRRNLIYNMMSKGE